ncbi:hypothetical protein K8R32_02735, partial [bacterium]|nr:hypothetical protein [bacterium]
NFPNIDINIPDGGLGIGTIFDLLVDWQTPGKRRDIYIRDLKGWYDGVEMLPSPTLQAWQLNGYDYPMFELAAKEDGWRVFLVESDNDFPDVDIPERAMQLLQLQRTPFEMTKLYFPVVKMEMNVDVSFLIGMYINGGFRIDETIKKVRLRLDDKGARAESAFAIITRGIDMGIYTIEKPFFVIFWREGLNFPSFVAITVPEFWTKKR